MTGHVLRNRGLRDLNTELEQFSMDSWSAPSDVGRLHFMDEISYFAIDLRAGADFSTANSVESLVGANARRYQGAMRATSPATRLHTLRTESRTVGQEPTPAGASPTT